MKLTIKLLTAFFLTCFLLTNAFAAERIFYEDCEKTDYTDYFLEDHWWVTYEADWNELKSELTQSSISHNGSYSMTYDPYLNDNPNSRIGIPNTEFGNLSNFDLHSHEGRYWYFRWYHRWEPGATYAGNNKNFYLNYRGYGDFVFLIQKTGPSSWQSYALSQDPYEGISASNRYGSTASTVDDGAWHKYEVFIDAGTSGDSNGAYWVKIDGVEILSASGFAFNPTISSAPITRIQWPSNSSAESGSQQQWLDDLEIYTLSGPNDIPSESGTSSPPDSELALVPPSNLNVE